MPTCPNCKSPTPFTSKKCIVCGTNWAEYKTPIDTVNHINCRSATLPPIQLGKGVIWIHFRSIFSTDIVKTLLDKGEYDEAFDYLNESCNIADENCTQIIEELSEC